MQTTTTRPHSLSFSQSFSRLDSPTPESRAASTSSTLPASGTNGPDMPFMIGAVTNSPDKEEDDVFSRKDETSTEAVLPGRELKPPETFDELPIEIRSLTERFLESLSAKVHPTPLSIDALSDMFQDFYRRAESHITTHIAALSTQLSRSQSASSLASRKQSSDKTEQQLLTVTEIADRKKARKQLELKRIALEEAVERVVCEKVYTKIWHHRSSDDEERDQKFRSRIAALSLVGIGLKELLVSGAEDVSEDVRRKTVEQEDKIRESLSAARTSIQDMTQEKYPLAKLQLLNSAHKSIVETLSSFLPSTSSADEILPTLIYTLITSDPQDVNVISDLHFIQRFRTSSKVDGETAYCLVNLEAAISFLETVELPSLRADEVPEGPDKSASHPSTPRRDATPMKLGITPASDLSAQLEPFPLLTPAVDGVAIPRKPSPAPTRSPRRLSSLIQMQTNRIEAAGDSLRGAVLDSADQAFDKLNGTLENSFRFLFGRIRAEQQTTTDGAADVPAPKTLEDARKLVSTPPPTLGDDEGSSSTSSPQGERRNDENAPVSDPLSVQGRSPEQSSSSRMLDLVGGRRPIRDHSVDSSRSCGSSGKRVSFAESGNTPLPSYFGLPLEKDVASPGSGSESALTMTPPVSSPLAAGTLAVESMRNLGSSLNPLNQFAKIGLFGRTGSTSNGSIGPTLAPTSAPAVQPISASPVQRSTLTGSETKTLAVAEEIRKIKPPSKRFLECKDAKDLKVGEVEELLAEFKRMAAALGKVVGA